MNSSTPAASRAALRFRLLDVPVSVDFRFLVLAALIGSMVRGLAGMLVGIVVVVVVILAHELGHALRSGEMRWRLARGGYRVERAGQTLLIDDGTATTAADLRTGTTLWARSHGSGGAPTLVGDTVVLVRPPSRAPSPSL